MPTIYLLILAFISLFSNTSYAKDITPQDVENNIQINSFILSGASRDISANIPLWVHLRNTLDGASALGWAIALGDKIPSQPIAVIEVLSLTHRGDIERVCPRPFMEDSEIYEMEQWMERAISSLSSFTMNSCQKESIRKECLAKIEQSLARKELWQ